MNWKEESKAMKESIHRSQGKKRKWQIQEEHLTSRVGNSDWRKSKEWFKRKKTHKYLYERVMKDRFFIQEKIMLRERGRKCLVEDEGRGWGWREKEGKREGKETRSQWKQVSLSLSLFLPWNWLHFFLLFLQHLMSLPMLSLAMCFMSALTSNVYSKSLFLFNLFIQLSLWRGREVFESVSRGGKQEKKHLISQRFILETEKWIPSTESGCEEVKQESSNAKKQSVISEGNLRQGEIRKGNNLMA